MSTTENQSSEQNIIQLLQEFNPFTGSSIVKTHQIWDDGFSDVSSINAPASDSIRSTIEYVSKNNKSLGVAILAPKGTGKTHILSRIRHHLRTENLGYFIYMCEYGNLSSVKAQFLQGMASSLRKPGNSGMMQWQDLATTLISKAIGRALQTISVVSRFPQLLSEKPQIVNQLSEKIIQVHRTNLENPYIARAIVWTLSPAHAPFAINWLAGGEISEAQAKLMDLPEQQSEDRESEAFSRTKQILYLIGTCGVPVVCFDELDGSESVDEASITLGGCSRAMVVASLAKDVCNSLQRGIILTSMYEKTWREEFQAAYNATAINDRIASKKIELMPLREEDTILLVTHWLSDFYTRNSLQPPYPLYPFNEDELRAQGKQRPTVREVLSWCAENIPGNRPDTSKLLSQIYQEVYSSLESFSDDNELISNSLKFCLKHLRGRTINRVKINDIDDDVKPKYAHNGKIQFKILGEEDGKPMSIGVSVAQYSHGLSAGAAIKYLTQYDALGLTRGCLIRSKSIALHWSIAQANLSILIDKLGGEWVSFKDEELKPLITIYQMHKKLDSEIISKDDFYKFIDEHHSFEANTLIQEILSDPSGQSPLDVIDEDGELEQLFSTFSSDLPDSFDNLIGLELTSP